VAKTEALEESCPKADPNAIALKTVVRANIVMGWFFIFFIFGFPSYFRFHPFQTDFRGRAARNRNFFSEWLVTHLSPDVAPPVEGSAFKKPLLSHSADEKFLAAGRVRYPETRRFVRRFPVEGANKSPLILMHISLKRQRADQTSRSSGVIKRVSTDPVEVVVSKNARVDLIRNPVNGDHSPYVSVRILKGPRRHFFRGLPFSAIFAIPMGCSRSQRR
jgi:hypothetical protein